MNKRKGQIPEKADYCRIQEENIGKFFSIVDRMEEELSFIKHKQTGAPGGLVG